MCAVFVMAKQFLQINFNFGVSRKELESAFRPGAEPIANVPGLRWKVWLISEARKEAGAIYLFDDESSVQKYLTGKIVEAVKSNPALSNISVKQFEMLEDLTKITRGPIELIVA
jgi:hypothetical protein